MLTHPNTRLCLIHNRGEWAIERRTTETPPAAALLGWLVRAVIPGGAWEFRPIVAPGGEKATPEEVAQIDGWRRQFNAGALVAGVAPHGVCSTCDKAQKRKVAAVGDGRFKCTECGALLTPLPA